MTNEKCPVCGYEYKPNPKIDSSWTDHNIEHGIEPFQKYDVLLDENNLEYTGIIACPKCKSMRLDS